MSNLNERIASLESQVQSSEDLLQEKLSALDQLQCDSAQLNEDILELRDRLGNCETERDGFQAETITLRSMVSNTE